MTYRELNHPKPGHSLPRQLLAIVRTCRWMAGVVHKRETRHRAMTGGHCGRFPVMALVCWGVTSLVVSSWAQEVWVAPGASWHYLKGTAEASSPSHAWRLPAFDDSGWPTGPAPIHYGSNAGGGDDGVLAGTILGDMRYNYTCVFLRHTFMATNAEAAQSASMTVNYDDGFVAWINGVEVARRNFNGDPEVGAVAASSHEADPAVEIALPVPLSAYLAEGTNVLAIQAFNRSLTASTDFRFETDLQVVLPDPHPPAILDITPFPGASLGTLHGNYRYLQRAGGGRGRHRSAPER